jgi:fused signal recognition particle receptor
MYRIIALFALILTLVVILMGSYVRLSDAGLGCPDWPGCYGQAVVGDNAEFKQQAEQAFPNNPLDVAKAWKEMTHRYVSGVLGLLVLLMALLSWWQKHCRKAAIISSVALLSLVILQAALGMWTVKMQVMPIIVTSHLLLGFLTFWLLFWINLRVRYGITIRPQMTGPRMVTLFAMLVLFLQIFLGAWTSTNYAAMVCTDFPQCLGKWWPKADYAGALDIFNGLKSVYSGSLAYDAQVAAHWLHRVGALVAFVLLGITSISCFSANFPKQIRNGGLMLCLLLLVQIGLGIINIRMGLPLWSALAHNGFAALLMLPLLYIRFYSKYELLAKEEWLKEEKAAETVDEQQIVETYIEPEPETLYLRLKSQLQKTRSGWGDVLANVKLGQKKIDDDLLEEIEASLIMADVGVDATSDIIKQLTERVKNNKVNDAESLLITLKQLLLEMLEPCNKTLQIAELDGPFVILVVGVNGVGKTTTIGKLAKRLQVQGHSVMLAAGDTFRAAAVEQLQVWGERNNIHVVAQHTGADSASVIYDAVQSAQAKGIDVLIADTAGRLHTKAHLLDELKKIKRIIGKLDADAPHEVLLVLDSGTGQNALSQIKLFNEAVELTGIALTKLDGTAKGGVIFALAKQFAIPIRFIGIGEGIDDLQDFHAEQFVEALFVSE